MIHDEEAAVTRCPEVHKIFRVGVKTRIGPVSGNNNKKFFMPHHLITAAIFELSIHLSISR